MPIRQRDNKWYWGSKGPFPSRKKAEKVAQAAHASGYISKLLDFSFFKEDPFADIKPITNKPRELNIPELEGENIPVGRRVYIKQGEEPPKGVRLHAGPQGGTFYDLQDLKSDTQGDEITKVFEDGIDDLIEFENSKEISDYENKRKDLEKRWGDRENELAKQSPFYERLKDIEQQLDEADKSGISSEEKDELSDKVVGFARLQGGYLKNAVERDENIQAFKKEREQLLDQKNIILDKRFDKQEKLANALLHSFQAGFDLDGEKININPDVTYATSRADVEERQKKLPEGTMAHFDPEPPTVAIFPDSWKYLTDPDKLFGKTKRQDFIKTMLHESLHSPHTHSTDIFTNIAKDRGWSLATVEDRIETTNKAENIHEFLEEVPTEIATLSITAQKYQKDRIGKAEEISPSESPDYAYGQSLLHAASWALAYTAETSDGKMSGKKARKLFMKMRDLMEGSEKETPESYQLINELSNSYGNYLKDFVDNSEAPDWIAQQAKDEAKNLVNGLTSETSKFETKTVSLDKHVDMLRTPIQTDTDDIVHKDRHNALMRVLYDKD